VDDPPVVRRRQGVGQRDRQIEDLRQRQTTARQRAIEALPLDMLHGEKLHSLTFLDAEDGDDVRMAERRHRLRLAAEAGEAHRIAGKLGGENLEGDGPLEVGVLGEVDLSHPPFAEFADNAVVRERAADHDSVLPEQDRATLYKDGSIPR
jgi:hypothetical protein